MLCPDCRACYINDISERCGTDRQSSRPGSGGARALERYRSVVPAAHRKWLNVPFADKNTVKKLGARWCPDRKAWYADSRIGESYVAMFSRWIPRTVEPKPVQIAPVAEKPLISFDELMDAIRFGDTVSSAVVSMPVQEKV